MFCIVLVFLSQNLVAQEANVFSETAEKIIHQYEGILNCIGNPANDEPAINQCIDAGIDSLFQNEMVMVINDLGSELQNDSILNVRDYLDHYYLRFNKRGIHSHVKNVKVSQLFTMPYDHLIVSYEMHRESKSLRTNEDSVLLKQAIMEVEKYKSHSKIRIVSMGPKILQEGTTYQMALNEGGTFSIPCKINGVEMDFIFDTGATNVSISLSEAIFLLKNDRLEESDLIGISNAQLANGEIIENTIINIRELELFDRKLENVRATIVNNLNAPLLLGQSAISKLGKIEIDYSKNTITILE